MPGMLNPHRRQQRAPEGAKALIQCGSLRSKKSGNVSKTPAPSDLLQLPAALPEQQDPRYRNSGLGNHNREKHAVRCETGAQPVEIKSTHNHFAGQVSVIFGTRLGVPVAGGTLQTAINFNNARASADMPFFNQDIFDLANALEPGTR